VSVRSQTMRIAMFYHSLVSDWNHGNAHFLRGVVSELLDRGHDVQVYEPQDAWSRQNLVNDHGPAAVERFERAFPGLRSTAYDPETIDLDRVLDGADLVLVHEWNDHHLVWRIGEHRQRTGSYRLLFHDTHHRSVTDFDSIAAYDLSNYDGVLAFGRCVRDAYLAFGITTRAWVWHEAADVRIFKPVHGVPIVGDVVWVGNWGDEERTAELNEFLIGPVAALRLRCAMRGVRYPADAIAALERVGIRYGGWVPNHEVPALFAAHRFTVHVPRRPYVQALRGIPTIRPFEAMACGIPLISAPWDDAEELFTAGSDYLVASNGAEMRDLMRLLAGDVDLRERFARSGRETILARHTCAHRVDELFSIVAELDEAPTAREAIA
jgi:spore maturation protein CgeB